MPSCHYKCIHNWNLYIIELYFAESLHFICSIIIFHNCVVIKNLFHTSSSLCFASFQSFQQMAVFAFSFIELSYPPYLKALEKSLKSFKDVVTKFKIQLSEHTDGKLLTMNDVYSSMIVLFKDTGLAKVFLVHL